MPRIRAPLDVVDPWADQEDLLWRMTHTPSTQETNGFLQTMAVQSELPWKGPRYDSEPARVCTEAIILAVRVHLQTLQWLKILDRQEHHPEV